MDSTLRNIVISYTFGVAHITEVLTICHLPQSINHPMIDEYFIFNFNRHLESFKNKTILSQEIS